MTDQVTIETTAPDAGAVTPPDPSTGAQPADGAVSAETESSSPPSAETAEQGLDAKLDAIWEKNHGQQERAREQPRDHGKFASTKPEGEVETEPTDQPQTEEKTEPESTPAIDLPQSWSADRKEMWESIPPEAREFVAKRESDAHKTISQQGDVLKSYQPLGELLMQNRDVFEAHNADPVAGIDALIRAQRALDDNPVEALGAIAKQYGIDLAQTFGGQTQTGDEGDEGRMDPHIAAALKARDDQITELNNRLNQRDQNDQTAARQARQAQEVQERQLQSQTNEELQTWAKDKPHFEAVRAVMATLVAGGVANSLDDAYKMACNADDGIRQKVQDAAAKADADKRKADEQKRVAEAKRQTNLQVGAQGRQTVKAPNAKWDSDEYLNSVYDRAQQGA